MIKLIDILNELILTNHYTRRKTDRVLGIKDIFFSPEALGTYSLNQVKEPIINKLKEDLLKLSTEMEKGSMAISKTQFVGYKIAAPHIQNNNKRYPINIIAEYYDEDKESTVTSVGTYYYVIIKDEVLITLILSNSTDPEVEMLDHVKRKYPLQFQNVNPSIAFFNTNDKYIIDLNDLMGVNRIQKEKITKASLPYTVKTDYRVSTGTPNFTHRMYGAGKIVDTSSGKSGKADQQGKLEWIDVDFGKPYLFKGKIKTIRRIDNIYAEPYFM